MQTHCIRIIDGAERHFYRVPHNLLTSRFGCRGRYIAKKTMFSRDQSSSPFFVWGGKNRGVEEVSEVCSQCRGTTRNVVRTEQWALKCG